MYYCDVVTMHMYYYCDYMTMYMQHVDHIMYHRRQNGARVAEPQGIKFYTHSGNLNTSSFE